MTAKIISPVDGSVYAERKLLPDSELATLVGRASAAQRGWRSTSLDERAAWCTKAVEAMNRRGAQIVDELAWQIGRPVSAGPGELRGFTERATRMIELAATSLADLVPPAKPGFTRFIRREPLGVVLVVAPWNYPLLTAVNTIVPALMAGNVVILKHATQTLLAGERFAEAFADAGLPEGVFTNIVVSHAQTEALLRSGQIDRVNFTGSVGGGQKMEQATAGTFTGVGLELGGKDPAYVRADADLAFAVENIVDGAFFNSGQSCCGIERVYVERSLYPEFVERAGALAARYVLGNPLDPATTLGPMVNGKAADFVRHQVKQATKHGARQVVDLSGFGDDKHGSPYLAPQILVDVDHSMAVMVEESFGPVVGVMPVDGDEQAVELMNDSPYGLSASIWTADVDAATRIGEVLATGTVYMNRADYLDPDLAWTGVKDTGRGATLSPVGYEQLTRPKSFHLRT